MNKNFINSRKNQFLESIPVVSIESPDDTLTKRCKFNFAYFDESQSAGQKFSDWNHEQLTKLLNKLKDYCRESLEYWKNCKIGSGQHRYSVLVEYGKFPTHSEFVFPKHVPHQAIWSRFRLEQSVRQIGFTISFEFHKKLHSTTGHYFDSNTFYIVFLDQNHKFYPTEK